MYYITNAGYVGTLCTSTDYTLVCQVLPLQKIELVGLLEDETHSVLSSVLMEGGTQAIDQIFANVCAETGGIHVFYTC